MKKCNGKGCNGAWDCENCRQPECQKAVLCDVCESDCSDEYYEIGNYELCPECMADKYQRSVD